MRRPIRFLRSILFGVLCLVVMAPGVASSDTVVVVQGQDRKINGEGTVPLCNAQAEPHLAAFGQTVVAGWVDDRSCDPLLNPDGFSLGAYAYSSDGGRSWTEGGFIRPQAGGQILSDPVLSVDAEGTFYYAVRARDAQGRVIIGVARSTDGGRTFSPIEDASPGRAADGLDQDKPWIAVDATDSTHSGNVYVAWTEFVEQRIGAFTSVADRNVLFSRSTDGATTFSAPIELSVPVSLNGAAPASYPGVGAQVAVGPAGEVYVAWPDYVVPEESAQYRQWSMTLWFTRSLDGGLTFEPPRLIAQPTGIGHVGLSCAPPEPGKLPVADDILKRDYTLVLDGNIKVRNWVSMAVDTSGSSDPERPDYNPYHGRLYLTFANSPTGFDDPLNPSDALGDEADVAFMYSETRGATWEGVAQTQGELRPRLELYDDATGSDQFHPTVAVDQEGTVAFTWYDRRSDPAGDSDVEGPPGNWGIDLYAAVSTDGGETFLTGGGESTIVRVSDESFDPPQHHNPFHLTSLLPPAPEDPSSRSGGGLPPIHGGWGSGCNHLGEYNGLVSTGPGEFVAAWGDNRAATADLSDMNIYADRLELG